MLPLRKLEQRNGLKGTSGICLFAKDVAEEYGWFVWEMRIITKRLHTILVIVPMMYIKAEVQEFVPVVAI